MTQIQSTFAIDAVSFAIQTYSQSSIIHYTNTMFTLYRRMGS